MYATNEWCKYHRHISDADYQFMVYRFELDMFQPEAWAAAIADLAPASCVTSEKLTSEAPGYLHFDAPSIRQYGLRYAAAYLKLI